MRVGVVILQDQRWATSAARWRRAEEYGFDHAWTYDHVGWRDLVDGPWFDAVPTLVAAATATSRIRLGTMVASPNFRHPVHFARELTALDDISGGRVTLGVGSGGTDYDATVLGWPRLRPRERVDRFAEFLELLDLVLRQERTTWEGRYYTAVDARSAPGCVQQPRLPFVVAGRGPRSLRLAARYGQGWVISGAGGDGADEWWRRVGACASQFVDALAEAGRDPSTVDRYVLLDTSPYFSLTSGDAFLEAAGRAGELGFTDVLVHWPRPQGWYAADEAVLDEIAAEALPVVRSLTPASP
jgi:alkanesulfonate monooxygenase SsuD/methylene tetrahydromethanopterin reductase-like flavin-dependent oxidoreductase (luciferase family)